LKTNEKKMKAGVALIPRPRREKEKFVDRKGAAGRRLRRLVRNMEGEEKRDDQRERKRKRQKRLCWNLKKKIGSLLKGFYFGTGKKTQSKI